MDKKRYYKLCVSTGYVGADHEEIVEVAEGEPFPDENELQEMAIDYLHNVCDCYAFECDEDGDELATTPQE